MKRRAHEEDEGEAEDGQEERTKAPKLGQVVGDELVISDRQARIVGDDEVGAVTSLRVFMNQTSFLPGTDALSGLRSLSLTSNSAQLLPTNLNALSSLETLELARDRKDSLLDLKSALPEMASLKTLRIRNFSLLPELPFGAFVSLQSLELTGTDLEELPSTIGLLVNVQQVDVQHNRLVALPVEIGNLRNLKSLDVSFNRLSSLPDVFHLLASLSLCNLRFNRLVSVPQSLVRHPLCTLLMSDNPLLDPSSRSAACGSSSFLDLPSCSSLPVSSSSSAPSLASSSSSLLRPPSPRPSQSTKFPLSSSSSSSSRSSISSSSVGVPIPPLIVAVRDPMDEEKSDAPRRNKPLSKRKMSADDASQQSLVQASDPKRRHFVKVPRRSQLLPDGDDRPKPMVDSPTASSFVELSEEKSGKEEADDNMGQLFSKHAAIRRDRFTAGLALVDDTPPAKRQRRDPAVLLNHKFSLGYLDFQDMMEDGFYDPGRVMEDNLTLEALLAEPMDPESREVILLDRKKDKRLNQLFQEAASLVAHISDPETRVKLLAMFVSDSMGGRLSEALDGSSATAVQLMDESDELGAHGLFAACRNEILLLKQQQNSNVVKLGELLHGVCRHRALLLKYLCDQVSPSIPCALVRGFRSHGVRHAWNLVQLDDRELIIDSLDAPHYLRDPMPTAQRLAYYPQYMLSVSGVSVSAMKNPKLGAMLGSGSFSQVFECDLGMPDSVALKICPFGHMTRADFGLLLGELRILPFIHHPNLVRFVGYMIATQDLRIFMEYVRGPTLGEVVLQLRSRGTNNAPRALDAHTVGMLMRGIARGVAYLHHKDIVHRDLKSDNVLLAPPCGQHDSVSAASFVLNEEKELQVGSAFQLDSREVPLSERVPKICDFNMSVHLWGSKQNSPEFAGTIRWMAPEVLRAQFSEQKPQNSKKSDMWSLGIILFEMLSLQLPYADLEPQDIMNRICTGIRPEAPSLFCGGADDNLPLRNALVELMNRMCSLEPDQRPDIDAVLASLEELTLQDDRQPQPQQPQQHRFNQGVG